MAKRNKPLPGPCKEVQEGYTEHGGCVTVTYYFDSHYKPVPRPEATRAIVHEYDEKERSVFRDYLTIDKGNVVKTQGRMEDGQRDTAGLDQAAQGQGRLPLEQDVAVLGEGKRENALPKPQPNEPDRAH